MRTRPLRGTILVTSAAAFLAGLIVAGLPMPAPADAAAPRPDVVLPVPDSCPEPPALVWTMAMRGYFTGPNTQALDAGRGWTLFQQSLRDFQEAFLDSTRCAVGVEIALFPHVDNDWPGGERVPFEIPADNGLYEEHYDVVAYRFPVEPGASDFVGGAIGRVQLYPVSTETEAPAKAVAATPYFSVLLHETLHTLTGWAKEQGVDMNLPPGDVHAAPKLSQYSRTADIEFYEDYLRQAVSVNGAYTGLPPQALLEAGTPTRATPLTVNVDPRIRVLVTGTTFYAWSASQGPLTVSYPGPDGSPSKITRQHGTHTVEGNLWAVNAPVTVCASVPASGVFRAGENCLTVPRTISALPLPPDYTEARAGKRAH